MNEPRMMLLKGKDYLPAAERVKWFKSDYPAEKSKILTKLHSVESDMCIAEAEIYLLTDTNGYVLVANDFKQEHKKDFGDFVEKASTGAIARALARVGYGTVDAQDTAADARLADAPVEPKSTGSKYLGTDVNTAPSMPTPITTTAATKGFRRPGKPAFATPTDNGDVDVL